MARPNGSGADRRDEDQGPPLSPEVEAVRDRWFGDDSGADEPRGGGR